MRWEINDKGCEIVGDLAVVYENNHYETRLILSKHLPKLLP